MCRYHLLKPQYIHGRLKELQRAFRVRVLLCHVDVEDVVAPLAQVTRAALLNECTLICAWSPEVSARKLRFCKDAHFQSQQFDKFSPSMPRSKTFLPQHVSVGRGHWPRVVVETSRVGMLSRT